MRKIGMFFFALLVLTMISSGCADGKTEPKKTEKEATPSVSLLPQDEPLFSSEELLFPYTNQTSSTTVITTTSIGASTTAAPPLTTTATPTITTTVPVGTTSSSTSEQGLIELPDHLW